MKKSVPIRVLQLKETKETRFLLFASLDLVKKINLEVKKENYNPVWESKMEVDKERIFATLEDIYSMCQSPKMQDYKGHSLSVSDMIEVDGVCYYCNPFGFVRMDFK